ncbi:hypothetical protein MMC31_002191 [Peltigera leucophlebia]|nr:hypothetical protein [Peltigera leucophlebia]
MKRLDKELVKAMLAKHFERHLADPIPDRVLMNLDMHISSNGYLEERAPRFTDVPDVEERTIGLDRRRHEHEGEEDSITVCTHSEDEATRKKEERAERRN